MPRKLPQHYVEQQLLQIPSRKVVLKSTGIMFGVHKAGLAWGPAQKTLASALATKAVQGAALALQGVHNIHGGHSLPAGVLSVGYGVADDVLQEHLQNTAGLFVDETADALYTTTASQPTDGRLGDALDVVAQHLAVTLGAALP